ncbi:MAG: hypothetical protein M3N51_07310 [Actinomycetota bacterium]|nr:hypothetical protein [Actinomycetota bacterium]
MRTLIGTKYLSQGAREGRPELVALGSGILLILLFQRINRSQRKLMVRRRLRQGQGMMVRLAGPDTPPFRTLRRTK